MIEIFVLNKEVENVSFLRKFNDLRTINTIRLTKSHFTFVLWLSFFRNVVLVCSLYYLIFQCLRIKKKIARFKDNFFKKIMCNIM